MPQDVSAIRFEKVLARAEAVGIGTAAAGASSKKTETVSTGKKDARALLSEAYQRLKDHPEIRRVAPDGKVTYSDPVLAIASSWATLAEDFGTASVEGADLTEAQIHRWALIAVQAWINRGDKGMGALTARVPKAPLTFDKDIVRIAVVGDAGYRGVPQSQVIFMIQEIHAKAPFDLIIHLGDVYFAAGEREMLRHLLVPFSVIKAACTLCAEITISTTGLKLTLPRSRCCGSPAAFS
jgi:hypothetical protein